jgi:phosphomannomutase
MKSMSANSIEGLIISVSGMRGIVGKNLTASIAAEYGCAFGEFLKEKEHTGKLSVCIGTDSRPSGYMLKAAVSAGLTSVGIGVIDLGLVTSPGVGVSLRELACAGGVIITASHNPVQYNGIKLLLDNGMAPPPEDAGAIKKIFCEKNFTYSDSTKCGKVTFDNRAVERHIDKVLAIVDERLIASKKFKVALDSVNGAGGPVTKKLLSRLGCKVFAINDEPTGIFAHTPEPTEENLKDFCSVIKDTQAEIGFAQDPDADRLAIVDENGNYPGEEYTLALAAKYVFSRDTRPCVSTGSGSAAANLSTSRMIDDIAAKSGSKVYRTPVGEANVAKVMLEHNCIIGGEGNGGVIDLRVGPIRDSLVGIALILQMMAKTGKTISHLISEIGRYHMIKEKFAADKNQVQIITDTVKKLFVKARLNSSDGYRFDFDDAWLHIRPSNTEPVMRVIAEAKEQSVARKYVDEVRKIRDGI